MGPARFAKGDMVVVKPGTPDPDFADITLGGWVGTITARHVVHSEYTYDIQWNAETLKNMPVIVRKRSERDGLELASMTLGESDLELYQGQAVVMERPTNIITKPLSAKDQDDRLRMVFGLTSDDPVPDVDEDTLQTYYEYLQEHLAFPFEADLVQETRGGQAVRRVKVLDLLEPEEDEADESYGLMAEVKEGRQRLYVPLGEIELSKKDSQYQLVSDYSYWFWNWR